MTITLEWKLCLGVGCIHSLVLMFDPAAQGKYSLFFAQDSAITPADLIGDSP